MGDTNRGDPNIVLDILPLPLKTRHQGWDVFRRILLNETSSRTGCVSL